MMTKKHIGSLVSLVGALPAAIWSSPLNDDTKLLTWFTSKMIGIVFYSDNLSIGLITSCGVTGYMSIDDVEIV